MNSTTLDAFEAWWEDEVMAFAVEANLPLHYVEEEFILDGELIKPRRVNK